MKTLHALAIALLMSSAAPASAQQAGPYFRLRLQSSGFTPPTGYLNVYAKSSNKHLYIRDSAGNETDVTGAGSGTVTSVGMTVPSFLSVSGSPITGSGTLALSLGTQAANRVFAGPSTGADAAPTFRALVAADLPNTAVSAGTCTACDLTIDAQGRITAKASGGGGGGTTQTIDVINATAATGKQITSAVADSGTNVGVIFNNSTALTGTTLLASFRNNGSEKFAIADDGALAVGGTISSSGSTLTMGTSAGLNLSIIDDGGGFAQMRAAAYTGSAITFGSNLYLGANSGLVLPVNNGSTTLGWTTFYWDGVLTEYVANKQGSQLTAAASITPVNAQHHVTGATTIDTISAVNFTGNPVLYLIADGGTITWSASGNILSAGTITQDKMQTFVYDSAASKWVPQQ